MIAAEKSLQRSVALAIVVSAVIALEIATRTGAIDSYTLIPPSQMAATLAVLLASGELNAALAKTGRVLASALFLSIAAGFVLGRIVHASPRSRMALQPVFTSYYAVPIFVFYPVFIVLFGLNDIPLILVGALFGIIAMAVATLNALDRVPASYLRASHAMQLTAVQRQVFVILPAMAPHLMIGFKLSVAYSLIGVIAGEFILSTEGVGFQIAYAYNNFNTPKMYALMLLVVLLAVLVNAALHVLEQRLKRRTIG